MPIFDIIFNPSSMALRYLLQLIMVNSFNKPFSALCNCPLRCISINCRCPNTYQNSKMVYIEAFTRSHLPMQMCAVDASQDVNDCTVARIIGNVHDLRSCSIVSMTCSHPPRIAVQLQFVFGPANYAYHQVLMRLESCSQFLQLFHPDDASAHAIQNC